MKIVDTVFAGTIRVRLIERPAPFDSDLFASGFYLDVKDETAPHFAIAYLDSDETAAKAMFRSRVDAILGHLRTIDHARQ